MTGTTGTTGTAESIEAGVRAIIYDVTRQQTADVGRDDDLVGVLGVDSLQGLQVLAGVEKRFDIRLPDEELIKLRTIGRIVDAVQRYSGGLKAADYGAL
jgi:acyl carrier protein